MTYADRKTKELFKHIIKMADKRLAKPIITREEAREIIKYGNTLDKAIIFLLFESGMRIGEFVQLKKVDIRVIEEGLKVDVPAGKTGARKIIVVEATKYVTKWLEEHPIKDKDAPLWTSPETKRMLTEPAIGKRIRLCIERMNAHRKKNGIPLFTKPFNLHNWRHSRASELGGEPGMTEQILCKYFGWEIGSSDMPRTYLHLTEEQIDRAVLRTYGKAKSVEETKIITHKTCQRCKEENPVSLNYCGRCGADLNTGKVVSNILELRSKLAEVEARLTEMEEGRRARIVKKLGKSKP